MSKALKKIVCVIVCLSMAFGGISVPNLFTVKGEQTKYMGSGSIAEGLPKALQSDASKLPSKSNSNVTRFTTDNYDNNNGAFDTNNWGTSAMWNFNGNNKYSGSMYTYPLAFKAAKDGMWISKPSTRIGSTYCVMTLTTNGDYTDFSVRPDFSTENAKVDKISDWTYDVVLENKNDNSQYLKTTIVQGSPFGFFTLKNSKKLTVAKYRKDVDSKIIYYDGTTLKNSSYVVLKVYDDTDEKNGYPKYDYYGIYLPKGTTLTQTDNSSSSVGNINIEFSSEQKAYFSMAWLTESDGSDAEALAIAKEYKAYAYNFITDTKAEYTYNQQVSTVSTKYIYTVDKMTAVKLISLTKEYLNGENYIRAVDDVSFSIKEGEFIAVIGASGSGKSTLINLISGLEKPTHGCVYVHDVNLTQLSLEEQISFRRCHTGVIFQKYNLIPAMNVFENIVLPAKLLEKKVDEKEVFRLAKMLGIEDKLFQVPDELSGGQQQRAAIARAVYTHPTILLGDELTGNLDSGTSISVMRLLKEICRQYKQTLLIDRKSVV